MRICLCFLLAPPSLQLYSLLPKKKNILPTQSIRATFESVKKVNLIWLMRQFYLLDSPNNHADRYSHGRQHMSQRGGRLSGVVRLKIEGHSWLLRSVGRRKMHTRAWLVPDAGFFNQKAGAPMEMEHMWEIGRTDSSSSSSWQLTQRVGTI